MRNGPRLVNFDRYRNSRQGYGARRYKNGVHDLMVIEAKKIPNI